MKTMEQRQLEAARRAVAQHRASAEQILASVKACGRDELTPSEEFAFGRHQDAMLCAIERVRLLQATRPAAVLRADLETSRRRVEGAGKPRPKSSSALRADLETSRRRVEGAGHTGPAADRRGRLNRRRSVAIHEAGHAVAFLFRGARVTRVSLNEDGGFCEATPATDPVACMAGAAAEAQGGFWNCQPSVSDLAGARAGLLEAGQTEAWLPGAMRQAIELVAAHWPAVAAVATQLEQSGSLSGDQVAAIAGAAARRARAARHARGNAFCPLVGLPVASIG